MKLLALLLLAAAAYGQGLIREEQTITVNGTPEVWRLQWKSPPKPICGATDENFYTCPCAGFAFGEAGTLDLIRLRQGREVERLALTPLFANNDWSDGLAIVPRWPQMSQDIDNRESPGFASKVAKRPVVRLMNFGDYDHDGNATEFYFQTHAGPCIHTAGVVIGVSATNPKLHAFGTARNPASALSLQKQEWQALLKAQGAVHIVDWNCGDHGSEQQIELLLQATPKGIDIIQETYACPRAANARPLKKEPR
jgi:hypothetical protein